MVERQEVSQEYVRFRGGDVELEGVMHAPDAGEHLPAVAVCHPHPLYGGDMNNNVVMAVCRGLGQAGIAALRFNFRGVGGSGGSHEDGIGEQEDVLGALAWLERSARIDSQRIGLAGYSFGTSVAFPVALRSQVVRALALVSPFLADSDWEQMKQYQTPRLFLCGSQDFLISTEQVVKRAEGLPGESRCEVIPGTDHFWWGYEGEIASRVTAFFANVL